MKNAMSTLLPVFAAACAPAVAPAAPGANPNPTHPTASAPAAAAAPIAEPSVGEATRAAFFDALSSNDEDKALALLAATPALAGSRTPRGTSAYMAALGRIVGNGFVRPQDNRVASAILALHPELDAFEAAAAGDADRVAEQIARDPSFVAQVHRSGWTPLHFAAFGGQARVVEVLVAHGAAVDAVAKNHFANTPLQVALLTRQGDVARLLLTHGANVNVRQAEGVTALHEAAQSGDVAVVRMLLDAGADPEARTGKLDDGRESVTPLDLARKAGHDDVAALLQSRTARDARD